MKNDHTPEPWIVGDDEDSDYYLVGPHDGDGIVYQPVVKLHSETNARRIVACVNACAGFSIEELEEANLHRDSIDAQNEIDALIKQCDELLERLNNV